ncbi:hypothetical protein JW935_25090 [candidate division KSB1 bacterium]|nr:hypothetical protein [candidate division KSB1 bacterium]
MDKSKFTDKKEWRKFGYGVAVILALIATVQLLTGKTLFPYFYITAAVFSVCALLLPIVLKPIYILFSYLGLILGWIMTRVILTVMFYLVFTLIGFTVRLFQKQVLDIKLQKNSPSYWIDRKEDQKINFENQF